MLLIAVVFITAFRTGNTDLIHKLFEYGFQYAFWAIGILIALFIVFVVAPGILAYHLAYKTGAQLFLFPAEESGKDSIELEIHNKGDGEIVITSVGLLDRRRITEKTSKGTRTTWKDIPIFSEVLDLNRSLPIRVAPKSIELVSLKVDRSKFERKFTGVFYEIDAMQSEQSNRYAKYLSKGNFGLGDCPKGFVRKAVLDSRLKKVFILPSKLAKK